MEGSAASWGRSRQSVMLAAALTVGSIFVGSVMGGSAFQASASGTEPPAPSQLGDLGLGNPELFDVFEISAGQASCLEVTTAEWGVGESSIMDDWVAVLYECGLNPGDVVSGDAPAAAPPGDGESSSEDEYLGDGSPSIASAVPPSSAETVVSDSTAEATPVAPALSGVGDVDDPAVLPFVSCSADGEINEISVLDPSTGAVTVLHGGAYDICGYQPSFAQLSRSGRFLIFTGYTFVIVDLVSGEQRYLELDDVNAWAMEYLSGGLNASERSFELGGFDPDGHGRLFFTDGEETFAQDVADFTSSGSISLVPLSDASVCYRQFAPISSDGSHCIWWSGGFKIGPLLAAPVSATDLSMAVEMSEDLNIAYGGWISPTTFVSVANDDLYGEASIIYSQDIGGTLSTVYGVSGDRVISAWVNGPLGRVYLASPTLDGAATEVYLVDLGTDVEPALIATIPGPILPINR